MTFVLAVGQGTQGQPATTQIAQQYKLEHGYQDGWHAVADPNWTKLESIIAPTSNGIPAHAILDQDLVLRFSSSSSDFVFSAESKLLQVLLGQGL